MVEQKKKIETKTTNTLNYKALKLILFPKLEHFFCMRCIQKVQKLLNISSFRFRSFIKLLLGWPKFKWVNLWVAILTKKKTQKSFAVKILLLLLKIKLRIFNVIPGGRHLTPILAFKTFTTNLILLIALMYINNTGIKDILSQMKKNATIYT